MPAKHKKHSGEDAASTAASMSAGQFRAWRKSLGMKQKDAADALGLKKRLIQYYETGERDGKKVEIPLSVRLACYAISTGIADFDGKDVIVSLRTTTPETVTETGSEDAQATATPAETAETDETGTETQDGPTPFAS